MTTATEKRKRGNSDTADRPTKTADLTNISLCPNNSKMPESYDYPPTPADQWKIVTWNVNSLPASVKKGFKQYVAAEDPTILCVQETKVQDAMTFLMDRKRYPAQYWAIPSNGKKGYAGTAIFSKIKPLSVKYGLQPTKLDVEGRVITLEFDDFFLVACYIPNSGDKLVRLPFRQQWDVAMNEYIHRLETTKPVIWTGDLNVAHQRCDLARPDTNQRSAGFTIEERNAFSAILDATPRRIDLYRHFYPDETTAKCYTFFSYRFKCREKRLGWRLDYFVVSEPLLPKIANVVVRSECWGASDHVPVVLWLKRGATLELAESNPAEEENTSVTPMSIEPAPLADNHADASETTA
ncbi:hypothetical protein H4R34_003558 [Dimargaris verticillata]|uniref:DNA-(apurinic or apyrimidinic site) endonuclease n=1 Tax=Dimargaris verticillata TaxID=2761393 RepID=A0A9W8ED16_9FUNG|nr:hypothetical protein H4R34_003558 [Dimargaris verticillata]